MEMYKLLPEECDCYEKLRPDHQLPIPVHFRAALDIRFGRPLFLAWDGERVILNKEGSAPPAPPATPIKLDGSGAVLLPSGAVESLHTQPGQYLHLICDQSSGFVVITPKAVGCVNCGETAPADYTPDTLYCSKCMAHVRNEIQKTIDRYSERH